MGSDLGPRNGELGAITGPRNGSPLADRRGQTWVTEIELRETFELLDKDQSGSVDAGELKQLLTCVGHSLTQQEAMQMIDEADRDGSGEVEFDEFAHIILSTQA